MATSPKGPWRSGVLDAVRSREQNEIAPSAPVAEDAYRRAITLPLFPGMRDADVDDVVTAVRRIATAHRA